MHGLQACHSEFMPSVVKMPLLKEDGGGGGGGGVGGCALNSH